MGGGRERARPILNGYRRAHFDYAFDYRTVDFDRGGIDSYATFGRTFDLFGDGSIRLAFTPGHSAGHMSVIARLEGARLRDRRRRDVHLRPARGRRTAAAAPFDAHNFRRSLQELQPLPRASSPVR